MYLNSVEHRNNFIFFEKDMKVINVILHRTDNRRLFKIDDGADLYKLYMQVNLVLQLKVH